MKRCLFAFALSIFLGGCADKQVDGPRIELTDVGFTLHLPPAMQQALDSAAPGFRAVRASSFRSDVSQAAAATGSGGMPAAFAAVGDFDQDGTIDAVVEGTVAADSALHVMAIVNGPTPIAVEITRFAVYDADAVGVYVTTPPAGVAGAFEVVAYPDSSVLYQYRDGGFQGRHVDN